MPIPSAGAPIPLGRVPILRQIPTRLARRNPALALFESWHGRFSDSPRRIAEELHRRGAPLRQVWALRDPAEAPDWVTVVAPDSPAYLRALGEAHFLVSNNALPRYFRKQAGTFYLQTWHGTPLKRIGFDVANAEFRARYASYLRQLRREVLSWDALVSPNRFSTMVFRHAFRFRGRILEAGYPRNDPLTASYAAKLRARIRQELGVPDGARALLYAPTWRDSPEFSLALDVGRLAAALPGDVVLLRLHELVADSVNGPIPPGVRDVSRHAEVSELYLAADVLITDYSSVMFDFAVTGKPIVFYAYDLPGYRDDLRGFYFDFEADPPGPLATTTEDLIEVLREPDAGQRRYADAYGRFRRHFCELEDGRASARVVSEFFEPQLT